jgi:hypothetical protein
MAHATPRIPTADPAHVPRNSPTPPGPDYFRSRARSPRFVHPKAFRGTVAWRVGGRPRDHASRTILRASSRPDARSVRDANVHTGTYEVPVESAPVPHPARRQSRDRLGLLCRHISEENPRECSCARILASVRPSKPPPTSPMWTSLCHRQGPRRRLKGTIRLVKQPGPW